MLKIKTENGDIDYKAEGTFSDIAADVMVIINSLYLDMSAEDEDAGNALREFITLCINDGSAFTKDGNPDRKEK